MRVHLALFPFIILLAACASNIPLEIREDITGENITVNAARSDINRYTGRKVRWGGTIAGVENKASDTWIEVVDRRLGAYGRPLFTDQSGGRFLVHIDGFLDPAIYRVDRPITVFGTMESGIMKPIDEHPYLYPLVRAQSYYLWEDYDPYARYPRDYGYPYGYYPYFFNPYGFDLGFRYGYLPHYYIGLHQYYPW